MVKTLENLSKAFVGESQARNRYTFAAEIAKKQGLHVIEAVFTFTANQELAHANAFMKHLSEVTGENIEADGTYPVEVTNSVIELLENAAHNEFEEYDNVYKSFAETAEREGNIPVASSFKEIGFSHNTLIPFSIALIAYSTCKNVGRHISRISSSSFRSISSKSV